MIMPNAWTLGLVGQAFEIGEPEQLIGSQRKPSSQVSNGFDSRDVPRRGRPNGLHPLRIVPPILDR